MLMRNAHLMQLHSQGKSSNQLPSPHVTRGRKKDALFVARQSKSHAQTGAVRKQKRKGKEGKNYAGSENTPHIN
eukprot:1141813-Pelagomonas_calceolata.AAC.1